MPGIPIPVYWYQGMMASHSIECTGACIGHMIPSMGSGDLTTYYSGKTMKSTLWSDLPITRWSDLPIKSTGRSDLPITLIYLLRVPGRSDLPITPRWEISLPSTPDTGSGGILVTYPY